MSADPVVSRPLGDEAAVFADDDEPGASYAPPDLAPGLPPFVSPGTAPQARTPVHPDLVYDVGAHKGEDSEFYLRLGFRVVAVEANPELAQDLRARFASEVSAGRFFVVDRAIAEQPGTVSFYINKSISVWGTADPDWAARNEQLGTHSERVEVQAARFDDIVRHYGIPHYVKIDIEGADMLCVESLARLEDRPAYVSIESSKTSWPALLREFEVLTSLGYTRFKVVKQRWHRSRVFQARNGEPVSHKFRPEASGPFGEYLEGEWLTREQALDRYRRIFVLYRLFGDNTPLERTIGRLPLVRKLFRLVGWYDTHAALRP